MEEKTKLLLNDRMLCLVRKYWGSRRQSFVLTWMVLAFTAGAAIDVWWLLMRLEQSLGS